MLMRHSVRPPTKAEVTPPGVASNPWPAWDTAFGELTAHGGKGAMLIGRYDREFYAGRGLLPATGCPAAGEVAVWASGKSRAIDTAKNVVAGMFPGCTVPVAHPDDENNDPVFHPASMGAGDVDAARAKAAVEARLPPGGVAALQKSYSAQFATLQRVLGCCQPAGKLIDMPSSVRAGKGDGTALEGALSIGSTAGQTILLEYVEGKPLAQVGWGRASKADIATMLEFHPLKFAYEARTPYIADRIAAPIARRILDALDGKGATKFTLLAGHDTNIAMLGGMLDLHWKAADYPRDDPPPGGALGFELLRGTNGGQFVRAFYQAQSMDQLRNLTPLTAKSPPAYSYIPITGCTTNANELCPLAKFKAVVQAKLDQPAP